MKVRMAMDKLKQALGLQITDEQLLKILKDDKEYMNPGNDEQWEDELSYHNQYIEPYFTHKPDAGDLDDYAELVQETQGGLMR